MATILTQEQKTLQRQVATQQTIRLMQLVELPYTSLEQEIQKEVDENPALEIYSEEEEDRTDNLSEDTVPAEYDENGDPLELSQSLPEDEIFNEDYYRDDDLDDYPSEREIENKIQRLNAPAEDNTREKQNVYYHSLQEQWQWQLGSMDMTNQQAEIANYLIGNLDEKGYLSSDLQAIVNELLYMENIFTDVEEVEFVLTHFVQELDPPGTGARNLQECLLLQLERKSDITPAVEMATLVVKNHFDVLLKKHYDKIKAAMSLSDEQLKQAVDVIKKLDPHPADADTPMDKSAGVINPDFTITSHNGQLTLTLNNQYIPKVRINKEFSNQYRFLSKEVAEKKRAEAEKFMKEYVDKANLFIGTLTTREMILYNTMYAIMMHQRNYFLTGDDTELKPMVLKTIAQEVNLDVSTVSRVSNSKYVQTDFGIISLKHLFSEAVNDDDVSSKVIKRILSDLIASEDKSKPLGDEMLCQMLQTKGYKVARRTVAKYREQMGIAVARLRKEV